MVGRSIWKRAISLIFQALIVIVARRRRSSLTLRRNLQIATQRVQANISGLSNERLANQSQ